MSSISNILLFWLINFISTLEWQACILMWRILRHRNPQNLSHFRHRKTLKWRPSTYFLFSLNSLQFVVSVIYIFCIYKTKILKFRNKNACFDSIYIVFSMTQKRIAWLLYRDNNYACETFIIFIIVPGK